MKKIKYYKVELSFVYEDIEAKDEEDACEQARNLFGYYMSDNFPSIYDFEVLEVEDKKEKEKSKYENKNF